MSETHNITEVPAKSFLKRLPKRQIVLTTSLVVATVVVAKILKDRTGVDVTDAADISA